MRTRALLKSLYVQVLVGIAAGIILGFVAPEKGARCVRWAMVSSSW
jgi:Na+/H+-dicarboxylate symporter